MPTKPDPDTAVATDHVFDLDDVSVRFQLTGGALSRLFGLRARTVNAVDGVTLQLRRGEVLGLVGESGSGKTTLGRALLGLVPTSSGEIVYSGPRGQRRVSGMASRELRALRTSIQMVFQDPHAALNPSMTIGTAVEDPLRIHGLGSPEERRLRVRDALERVGLVPVDQFLAKYPSDLSGGQKQRAVIARAIVLDPDVLVADEPVSMLDMSVRAKILRLMLDLKRDLGLSYVYITHDLATAKYFCDRIAIMYLGRVVEIGPTAEIFANPRHPYTKALLKAVPEPDPEKAVPRDLPRGEIPDAADPPRGCAFHPRCAEAVAACGWEGRDLRAIIEQHWTRTDLPTFELESAILGDLEPIDTPEHVVTLRPERPEEADALLEQIRAEDPDDPFWTGVEHIVPSGTALTVTLHPADPPPLYDVGDVQVACVHYAPEPG